MNEERRQQTQHEAWVEMVAMAPELLACWLDGMRGVLLQAGDIFLAARASIFLITVLSWIDREEDIQEVVDDLRFAARIHGRHGEVIFALYSLTNAIARGEAPGEAAVEALARLQRIEQSLERNHSSGANDGAGDHGRRSSMETQQVVTQEQKLKAERVQEELMADEPYLVSLKAERVQEPVAVAMGGAAPLTAALQLSMSQAQPVTIELLGLQVVITLHGTNAGAAGLVG